jgi:hypothetical protein
MIDSPGGIPRQGKRPVATGAQCVVIRRAEFRGIKEGDSIK